MMTEIEKLDNFGRGIAYINGKICFVPNAFPGDCVLVEVVFESRKYLIGEVKEYYKKSEFRTAKKCPYSEICGGCALQGFQYDEENAFKVKKVVDVLTKFGDISEEKVLNIVYQEEESYRNKIVLHGDDNGLGFYEDKTKTIVDIKKCLIADERINEIIAGIRQIKYNGQIEAMIRVSNDSKQAMVSITGNVLDYRALEGMIDVLIINGKAVNGCERIISMIGNKKYYVSSKSFFQINKSVVKLLYDEVLSVVKKIKPNKVLDLYCGTGTIGIYICEEVKEVIGVESVKEAVADAFLNKKLNACSNIEFICERVENVIDRFNDIDMIIVDPPRAGLDKKTIENILRISPKNLVYVSCDVVTLGRDLKILGKDYDILYVKPFNMFPRSYHVECVAVLCLKENTKILEK